MPVEGIITPETRIRLPGRGLPRSAGRGDLVVSFELRFPEFLSLEQKQHLAELL